MKEWTCSLPSATVLVLAGGLCFGDTGPHEAELAPLSHSGPHSLMKQNWPHSGTHSQRGGAEGEVGEVGEKASHSGDEGERKRKSVRMREREGEFFVCFKKR